MPELHLHAADGTLQVRLDELSAAVPWPPLAIPTDPAIVEADVIGYGRRLFERVFADEALRARLLALPDNTRLQIVCADETLERIPWETLRTPDDDLLAARLAVVRGLPAERRPPLQPVSDRLAAAEGVTLLAIPVSPVDEKHPLATEAEWERLTQVVQDAGRRLHLRRVRPPTAGRLEQMIAPQSCTIVHFMGHGRSERGASVLVFEDERGRTLLESARAFARRLDENVLLVVLNACESATSGGWTEFGNIARGLAQQGTPYALGMAAPILDAAALVFSRAFYAFVLQGRSVEDGVRRTRRALLDAADLPNRAWLATLPVLYTALPADAAAGTLARLLPAGAATIDPDPASVAQRTDLNDLPQAVYFVGRGDEQSVVIDHLRDPAEDGFVAIYGLGGVGKTALARAAVQRMGWQYDDRVLALSFETFARLEGSAVSVDSHFAPRFYERLADFYAVDASKRADVATLQREILQARRQQRSLLVLDNLETLLDALARGDAGARTLAGFVRRLREGRGGLLVTSRLMLPAEWGRTLALTLEGLDEEAGATLFLNLLPEERRVDTPPAARRRLAQRVDGHPLAIRLLAGRFGESGESLDAFLNALETHLAVARQQTPDSLADPERQATLYACMAYSVDRLEDAQRDLLAQLAIFRSPFPAEYGVQVITGLGIDADVDEASVDAAHARLNALVRLGLLTRERVATAQGALDLLELHPMLRWYVGERLPAPAAAAQTRYAAIYAGMAEAAWQPGGVYDHDARFRAQMQRSQADLDGALTYLSAAQRSRTAYFLANWITRVGQPARGLALYEDAQELFAVQDDRRSVAVVQSSMADVLSQMGKPQEAMKLYEQSLRTKEELGDRRGVAVTQANYGQLLIQLGEHGRALALFWAAYTALASMGYASDAATLSHLLTAAKTQSIGAARFDALWAQEVGGTQPDWLAAVAGNADSNADENPDSPDNDDARDAAARMDAIQRYVGADDLDAKRQIVAQHADLLLSDAAGVIFAQNIEHARSSSETQWVDLLEFHRSLLQVCREMGIDAAFAAAVESLQRSIPFPPDLIGRAAAALTGSPADRRTLLRELDALAAQTQNADLLAFYDALQTVLVGGDLAEAGRALGGVYAQAWSALRAALSGGLDQLLATMIQNTVAVLGPAAEHRARWRSDLTTLRNQAVAAGDEELAAFVDALLALLDAGGDPAGLGAGLAGPYADAWRAIVAQIGT